MSGFTPKDVRLFLKGYLDRKLEANGGSASEDLPEDCDLLLSGMIDSIGLLELITAVQEFVGRDIDFEALDPEQMTVVGSLCRFVCEQANSNAA